MSSGYAFTTYLNANFILSLYITNELVQFCFLY